MTAHTLLRMWACTFTQRWDQNHRASGHHIFESPRVRQVCVYYLGGLVGSPAVLVAVEAGQKHILIGVHLAEAQGLVGVVTDHIVAVQQLFGLWVSILQENIWWWGRIGR